VAFIVFLLAYMDKSKKVWNTRLTYFLILEAFFLIGIAFKSVYDYTSLWGFTQKRLWGYTSMAWLTGAMVAFLYHYKNQTSNLSFFRQIMTYTMAVILIVNISNFDSLIYHNAKASTSSGIDYEYLAGLSPDARYYEDALKKLMPELEKSTSLDYSKLNPAYAILGNIGHLRYKYGSRRDMNSFNIAEYQEYLATQHIDIDAYRSRVDEIHYKLTPPQPTPLPQPIPIQ
jgi:hypothetical protein